MVQMIFNEEKEAMRVLINAKNRLQNFSYKLDHDLNSKDFFANVVENIRKFDSLSDDVTAERMFKYHFINDLKEMREVLHLFFSGLQSEHYIKSRTSEELIKSCNVFPDNIGKRIAQQIAYIPLLDLFFEKLAYLEYFKKKLELDKKIMGQTWLERQEEDLFGKGIFSKKFPKDEDFIDYEMRNRYVERLEEEYSQSRKAEIEESIAILIDQYSKVDISIIGAAYWDNKQKVDSAKTQAFREVIESMARVSKEEEHKALQKLESILITEVEERLEYPSSVIKTLEIKFNKGDDASGLVNIETNFILSQVEIDNICGIFILKSKMELSHISFLDSANEKSYTFRCQLAEVLPSKK